MITKSYWTLKECYESLPKVMECISYGMITKKNENKLHKVMNHAILGTYQTNNFKRLIMKQFTLINQLTEQYTIIVADNRRVAQRMAVELAIDLGLDHSDNHVAYWIEKQDYLSINGFTELKAPESKPMNTKAVEQLTLQQLKNSFSTNEKHIKLLEQKAGDATTAEECKKLHRQLHEAKEEKQRNLNQITNYLITGEWGC